MPDSFNKRADEFFESVGELADALRRTIEPADRFGESLALMREVADAIGLERSSVMGRLGALATDPDSLSGRPPIAAPPAVSSGFLQLGELFSETANRDGQQEQLKLIGEQLAEQKRTNDHLQAIAEKDSRDVLGP